MDSDEKRWELINQCSSFIGMLSPKHDADLIFALQEKITQLSKPVKCQTIEDISDRDMAIIMRSIKKVTESMPYEYDAYYRKLKDVSERIADCNTCLHSVTITNLRYGITYKDKDNTNPVCGSCQDRFYCVQDKIEEVEKKWESMSEKAITDDLKLCKQIVYLINRKLTKIKQHETSEH